MVLDLTTLLNHFVSEIKVDQAFVLPKEIYEATEIKDLKNTRVSGVVTNLSIDIIELTLAVSGVMVLEDAISLELIDYPFSVEINEEIEKNKEKSTNSLDITDILWQNIMLEVPLRLTNVSNDDFNEYQGDGWKLISEDSIKNTNNPFQELKDILREE